MGDAKAPITEAVALGGSLPIPYAHRGTVVRGIAVARPTAGDIATVARLAADGDAYAAMSAFVVGGTALLTTDAGSLSSRQERMDAVRDMPFANINWCIVEVLLGLGCRDAIEGAWDCPRCGKTLVVDEESGEKISALPVRKQGDGDPQTVKVALLVPVQVTSDKGEVVEHAESMEFRFATMTDCSRAAKRVGSNDAGRLNLEILRNSLLAVNGAAVTEKYRGEWADVVLSRLDTSDLRAIGREASRYGYEDSVERECAKCGKRWPAPVDVTGFFVSGLRELSA